jgi:glyoxylase-like metal-dependent hydrolase (beta-lactamase superfamily II)
LKKFYFTLGIIILLILILAVGIFPKIGSHIQVEPIEVYKNPKIQTREDIRISYLETGSFETLEGFLFAGGSFFKPQKGSHMAVLISHPSGNILIDTGIGKNIDSQYESMPTWLKPFFSYEKKIPASEILLSKNITIESILLTHMHWDHASGLKDFSNVPFYTTKEEITTSQSESAKPPAYMTSQYEGLTNSKTLEFKDGPYEIYKESVDFYKDGSVVIVRLPGHSPGSIGIFVNLSPEKRYFFTGDLTWRREGFQFLTHKYFISSLLVDLDKSMMGKEIARISEFQKLKPEIKVVPSHDSTAYGSIEKLEQK